MGAFRKAVLRGLQDRGTFAALREMEGLVADYPGLRHVLSETRLQAHRKSWQPIASKHVLALIRDRERRHVASEPQLLQAVVASLERLQRELRGETPTVMQLWNQWIEDRKTSWRPATEQQLTDFVKVHLGRDLVDRGIVVNREVQIRVGEHTDIHVDAVTSAGACPRRMKVIVEAKGCWNEDISKAMQIQLRDRYLKDNECRHGVYLVGWFNREPWDGKDSRRRKARAIDVEETRRAYQVQAGELSTDGLSLSAFVLDCTLPSGVFKS